MKWLVFRDLICDLAKRTVLGQQRVRNCNSGARRTEVSRQGQGGVWARQRGRGGGQDQTLPVACPTTAERKRSQRLH